MSARLSEPEAPGTQNTTPGQLTLAYIQKLGRQTYWAIALSISVITFAVFWLLFKFDGNNTTILFSDAMYAISSWIAASWIFLTVYRAGHGPLRLARRHRQAWLLIGFGLVANGLGGACSAYYDWTGQLNAVPSYADIGYTLFYMFTLAGLLLMPLKVQSERFRIRIFIDSLVTTLCILGISWYLLFASIFASTHNIPQLITVVSYPFWDILLILAIILFIRRRAAPFLRRSLLLCSLGILAQVWADFWYAYGTSAGIKTTEVYVDTFWFIGYLLIGLAALYQYHAIARKAYAEQIRPPSPRENDTLQLNAEPSRSSRSVLLQSLLTYIPLIILLALTLYSDLTQDTRDSFFLIFLTVVVGLLATARYILANHENEMLLREREQRRAEAERLRLYAAQLTGILDMDTLRSRIVTLAASELDFDAAELILFEDYNSPFDPQAALLIHAATSAATEILAWRIDGEYTRHCSILLGKEIEVSWAYPSLHVPTPLHLWHKEQQHATTLFVPLSYQGKKLGALGFSRRTPGDFGQRESYIVRAFAEEAASAIEHAHLYEVAQDNMTFSRAMANVAARLNSVVASGMGLGAEIQQLICTEGANALQADYVLLYVNDKRGQLLPLALYVEEPQLDMPIHEWPIIRQDEYEIQALHSLQPVLMEIEPPVQPGSLPHVNNDYSALSGPLPVVSSKHRALPAFFTPPEQSTHSSRLPAVVPGKALVPLKGARTGRRSSTLREELQKRHVPTAILAPLIGTSMPVGLLVLARSDRPTTRQKRPFAVADLPHAQDFTEQAVIAFTNAQLYQELRNAHRRLQEVDQLKDQFMITASHELRTPLTAVQGYLELLTQYGETLPPDQQQEFMQKARRGCDELVLLLSNVMDASRLEVEAGIRPAHLTQVNVRQVVESLIELIEPQTTQERRTIHVHIPNNLLVKADPARLRQVILNLSINALKYSPSGSPISFSARSVFDHQQATIISVADKGKGIKPEDQGRLFQRFVRLERDLNSNVRGSGLGLYISRRLVEAMNGKIWIESSGIPGAGSMFHILLPSE